MIEENLINYGVLGLWTASLLYEKIKFQGQIKKVIERNTEALININSRMKKHSLRNERGL